MGLFGRKKTSPIISEELDMAQDNAEVDETSDVESDETEESAEIQPGTGRRAATAAIERGTQPSEPQGPWDHNDAPDDVEYIDLGALHVPALEGLEVNIEVDQGSNNPTAVNLIKDGSGLQVQAFAAPRTAGVWDEIRGELATAIKEKGGIALPMQGRFGWELQAGIPVRLDDGRVGQRPVRFVGVDGPRWFVRGVISGKAASAGNTDSSMDDLFSQIVVVRGALAMAPRDLLDLKLPDSPAKEAPTDNVNSGEPDLGPLVRGPEITQIG